MPNPPKIDPAELAREHRNQKRIERLGTSTPVCINCGEDDSRCLEEHHLAGHNRDDFTAIHCRNCHRKRSDEQLDHPKYDASNDPLLDKIGHFLLGLADTFRALADKLYEFGLELIERAKAVTSAGAA